MRSSSLTRTFKPSSNRLFDHFLVIGCIPSNEGLQQLNLKRWTEQPSVLLKFPHNTLLEAEAELPSFAFPSDVAVQRVDTSSNESSSLADNILYYNSSTFSRNKNTHVFVIKTVNENENDADEEELFSHDLVYGLCVSAREVTSIRDSATSLRHRVSCPVVYCLLSRYPYFELHQSVISAILKLIHLKRAQHFSKTLSPSRHEKPIGPHCVKSVVQLLKQFYNAALLHRGQVLTLHAHKLVEPISFQRPNAQHDNTFLIQRWAVPLILQVINVDQFLDLLECALCEYKILVICSNLSLLSSCILSFIPMLRPLNWCGIMLPILPVRLSEFIESPVPIIVGMSELNEYIQQDKLDNTTIVWFPDTSDPILTSATNGYLGLPNSHSLLSLSGSTSRLFHSSHASSSTISFIRKPRSFKSILYDRKRFREEIRTKLDAFRSLIQSDINSERPQSAKIRTPPSPQTNKHTIIYEFSDKHHLLVEEFMSIVKQYIRQLCMYTAFTAEAFSEADRDKKLEPLAKVLRQTQMMNQYISKKMDI